MYASRRCAGLDTRWSRMSDVLRRPSIALRLALVLVLLFTGGGIAVSVAALAYGRAAADRSYDQLLIGAANQIAAAMTLRDGRVEVDIPVSVFELLALAPDDRIFYAVLGPDGELLTGYDGIAPQVSDQTFFRGTFTGEPARFALATRRFAERSFSGTVQAIVGQTTQARQELSREITQNALILVGTVGLLMSALAILAVRAGLRPLRRIEEGLIGRTPRDLTPIDVEVPQEVGSLVDAINRFMSRLDRQIDTMKVLIADASHQLRTPVAAIRAQAELAEGETDPIRQRLIVGRIHQRSINLSRLTDQLLSHAMIIHRAEATAPEELDLRRVAMRAIDDMDHDPTLVPGHIQLDLPEDAVLVLGDELSLVEACKNLVGNALRHGAPPVSVRIVAVPGGAEIVVRDEGSGPPEPEWDDAGRRFASHSGVSAKSAGLGLAIVHAVARAHGGALSFRRAGNGGFEAVILVKTAGGIAS